MVSDSYIINGCDTISDSYIIDGYEAISDSCIIVRPEITAISNCNYL